MKSINLYSSEVKR